MANTSFPKTIALHRGYEFHSPPQGLLVFIKFGLGVTGVRALEQDCEQNIINDLFISN